MRKMMIVAAGMAISGLIAADANAAVRSFWDQEAGKWVKYDTSAKRQVARSYSPIKRQVVKYNGPFKKNTIVIDTSERRLYYVLGNGKALKYGVGVGKEGFQWNGTDFISRKAEWPGWTPPPEMIARERKKGRILPKHMKGGPNNPLGARALYIGGTLYRIHGSNEPWSIGRAVSSGCIRLINDDVIHLYKQVKVGTRVVVLTGRESQKQLLALANPAPPKKKVVPVEDVKVAEEAPANGKDDDVVIVATAQDEDLSVETTGSVIKGPRVKDDDVVIIAPKVPAAAEARVKDDDVVAPAAVEEDVSVLVGEEAIASAN